MRFGLEKHPGLLSTNDDLSHSSITLLVSQRKSPQALTLYGLCSARRRALPGAKNLPQHFRTKPSAVTVTRQQKKPEKDASQNCPKCIHLIKELCWNAQLLDSIRGLSVDMGDYNVRVSADTHSFLKRTTISLHLMRPSSICANMLLGMPTHHRRAPTRRIACVMPMCGCSPQRGFQGRRRHANTSVGSPTMRLSGLRNISCPRCVVTPSLLLFFSAPFFLSVYWCPTGPSLPALYGWSNNAWCVVDGSIPYSP